MPLLFGIVLIIAGAVIFMSISIGNKRSADKYNDLTDPEMAEEFPMLHAEPIADQSVGKTDGDNPEERIDYNTDNDILAGEDSGENELSISSGKTALELNEELYGLTGVDLQKLMSEYPETVGWIYFENEDLSYPVMQSEDNDKYLNKAYDGSNSKAGAIFLDYESSPDMSDPHSLIYGHNMADTTMFGKLHRYMNDSSYYADHKYFRIYTKEDCYRYEIFAYGEVEDSNIVFWTFGPDPQDMQGMMDAISASSLIETDITVKDNDRFVTLSTCTALGNKREIVCARCVPWEN